MELSVRLHTLRLARKHAKGLRPLAKILHVESAELKVWLAGRGEIPIAVFNRAAEYINAAQRGTAVGLPFPLDNDGTEYRR